MKPRVTIVYQCILLVLVGGTVLFVFRSPHGDSTERSAAAGVHGSPAHGDTARPGEVDVDPLANKVADSSVPTNAPTPAVGPVALSERLHPLLEGNVPPLDAIRTLSDDEKDMVLALYLRCTNLMHKRAITTALGFVGDERAVCALTNMLTQDYQQKRLTAGAMDGGSDEEAVMYGTIRALGILGKKYSAAYSFVLRAAEEGFWRGIKSWTSSRGEGSIVNLVSVSIQALGLSGRAEVPSILEAYKLTPNRLVVPADRDSPIKHSLHGSITDAAFYYDVVTHQGQDALMEAWLGQGMVRIWNEWRQTDNGTGWTKWCADNVNTEE
jgi:hypothetical protein